MADIIPIEIIENKIFVIRGLKVMLDSDLAELYGVETFNLNKAVKRNIERFPEDFMFQLTETEWESLRLQIVTSKEENNALIFQFGISKHKKGGRRYNPYVFTEQGVAMLSSVLKSKRAAIVNVQIMRIFVKLRQMALTHNELAKQLNELEQKFINYAKDTNLELKEHDQKFDEIFKCLQYLVDINKPGQIGF
ncbi:MAG TPA: DNA-binding protein [Cyanobacteria bacterium UBA9971]|nr:DNA-binding protein [Cyanobacteria bacterium UBA9971]